MVPSRAVPTTDYPLPTNNKERRIIKLTLPPLGITAGNNRADNKYNISKQCTVIWLRLG